MEADLPKQNPDDVILLAHGGGGTLTSDLIRTVLLPALGNPVLERLDDGACVTVPEADLVLTTDSYVVDPIFFPGGDIGVLAVAGTVNDLAMQGAEPRYLTLGLIIEEGLPVRELGTVVQSVADTAAAVGVTVVAGDTKVVERGRAGGLYINTAGLGVRQPGVDVHVANGRPGDAVLITGTIGDHGMAVMSRREGLEFESELCSDAAPLWDLVKGILGIPAAVHCLRDPTRGGLTAALCDVAAASGVGVRIGETTLPVKPSVRSACGLLGLDPLNVANEGKALVVCDPSAADAVLETLRQHPLGRDAVRIGELTEEHPGAVVLETGIGGERILTPPAGHELPRIC